VKPSQVNGLSREMLCDPSVKTREKYPLTTNTFGCILPKSAQIPNTCKNSELLKMPRPAKNLTQYTKGDPCKGKTSKGQEIIGIFVQAGPGDTAFLRGVVAQHGLASPFEPTQVYKVTRESLRKC
jgi:hypothetical protein